jgi:hypothetical protein
MGTTKAQRQEIDDMENLAAGIDFADRLLERLAQATRHAYTLEQLADGRQRLNVMRQIVIRRRQALTQAAHRTERMQADTRAEEDGSEAEGEPDERGATDES